MLEQKVSKNIKQILYQNVSGYQLLTHWGYFCLRQEGSTFNPANLPDQNAYEASV